MFLIPQSIASHHHPLSAATAAAAELHVIAQALYY